MLGGRGIGGGSEAIRASDRARVVGCAFTAAMVAAPFLALLYGPTAGLAIAAVALSATAFLAADATRVAPAEARRRLIVAAVLNGGLALACLAVLTIRWL